LYAAEKLQIDNDMKTIRQIIGGLILGGALWLPSAHAATGTGISPIFTLDTRGVGITIPPQSQTVAAGSNVTFTVTVAGLPPFNYQWYFNGNPISGATGASLTVTNVQWAKVGNYAVVVWNGYGTSTSASATLAVLTDGANGSMPTQITNSPVSSKPVSATGLVLVTHGWQPVEANPSGPPAQPWMVAMTNGIVQQLVAKGQSANWQVVPYYWLSDAWTATPGPALDHAKIIGAQLGKELATKGYQRVLRKFAQVSVG
jgi:hypothetical protein